jgi:multimeric flavodoxin WrbA
MKVLAICGSPRRHGNTEVLLDIALEALSAAGIAGDKVLLAGKTVGGCLACLKCREARDGRCHGREDDLTPVFPDIYEAEGLILGSPVYFGAATPEMAAFITASVTEVARTAACYVARWERRS